MVANKFFRTQIIRSLSFSKQRLAIIFISIFMGAAVSNAFLNVYFDIDNKMSRELKAYGANMVLSATSGNISAADASRLKAELAVTKLIAFSPYLFFTPTYGGRQILLGGVDFEQFKRINKFLIIKATSGKNKIYSAAEYEREGSIVLGVELAATLDKKPGQDLVLTYTRPNGALVEKKFRIKAVIETGDANDNIAFISLQQAKEFSGLADEFSFVSIIYDAPIDELNATSERLSAGGLELKTITSVSQKEGAILQKIKGLMFLISVVILIISSTSVNTTLSSIIFSRKKEIALHISLGAGPKNIIMQFGSEVFIVALISSLAGCVGGYALAQLLGALIFDASIDFRTSAFFAAVIISLVFAAAAAFLPIKKALSTDIIENLRGE